MSLIVNSSAATTPNNLTPLETLTKWLQPQLQQGKFLVYFKGINEDIFTIYNVRDPDKKPFEGSLSSLQIPGFYELQMKLWQRAPSSVFTLHVRRP